MASIKANDALIGTSSTDYGELCIEDDDDEAMDGLASSPSRSPTPGGALFGWPTTVGFRGLIQFQTSFRLAFERKFSMSRGVGRTHYEPHLCLLERL